jgi:hypothetical protein
MLLANQIGRQEVLLECIAAARAAKGQEAPAPGGEKPE